MAVPFNKFQPFVENLAQKGIDLSGAQLTVGMCNAANPPLAADGVIADEVQVAYTNLSTRVCTVFSHAQTGGTFKLCITDLVLTTGATAIGPFQYVFLYDDGSVGDMLIGWYDYGLEITLAAGGETLTIDFDGTNGVLQLA